MRKYNVILFFFLAALIVTSGGIFFAYQGISPVGKQSGRSLAQNSSSLSYINLAEDYQKYAANIVDLFKEEQVNNSEDLPLLIKDTKNNLIALTVPKELAETHLTLVISLGLMERGLTNDNLEQYEDGAVKFEKLLEENDWLSNF